MAWASGWWESFENERPKRGASIAEHSRPPHVPRLFFLGAPASHRRQGSGVASWRKVHPPPAESVLAPLSQEVFDKVAFCFFWGGVKFVRFELLI